MQSGGGEGGSKRPFVAFLSFSQVFIINSKFPVQPFLSFFPLFPLSICFLLSPSIVSTFLFLHSSSLVHTSLSFLVILPISVFLFVYFVCVSNNQLLCVKSVSFFFFLHETGKQGQLVLVFIAHQLFVTNHRLLFLVPFPLSFSILLSIR